MRSPKGRSKRVDWGRGRSDTAVGTVGGSSARSRVREVRCGKPRCRQCPHRTYLYVVWRGADGKQKERYIGRIDDERIGQKLAAALDPPARRRR